MFVSKCFQNTLTIHIQYEMNRRSSDTEENSCDKLMIVIIVIFVLNFLRVFQGKVCLVEI